MASVNVFVATCCISAFIAASGALLWFAHYADESARATRLHSRVAGMSNLRILQTGIPGFTFVVGPLLELALVHKLVQTMQETLNFQSIPSTEQGLLSCLVVGGGIIVVGFTLMGRSALGLIAAAACLLLMYSRAARIVEKRKEQMRDALPEALQAMSACFGAGFTLQQTFNHLQVEVPGPLGHLFGIAAASLQTGAALPVALAQMRGTAGLRELSFVSVALAVQHQTGGSMQRVIDATRDSLKEELALSRSLRVHTAQARLSARVVIGVTLGLVGAMMLLSRDFLNPFFESLVGMMLLLLALVMQLAGIMLIRRLLKIELG